jgi:parallel beta-helix repeat protein
MTGVDMVGPGSFENVLEDNIIGRPSGADFLDTNSVGVAIEGGASNNEIIAGTNTAGLVTGGGNMISGNRLSGVVISGPDTARNLITSNFIGVDETGMNGDGNVGEGVRIEDGAHDNTVGELGLAPNVISANGDDGVFIFGSGTIRNQVINNQIGADVSGNKRAGDQSDGVAIEIGASDNVIANNTITSNSDDGVLIRDTGTSGNQVVNNSIGSLGDEFSSLDNNTGVHITAGASDNIVGYATTTGDANTIVGNVESGVAIDGAGTVGNTVVGNHISNNFDGVEIADFAAENMVYGNDVENSLADGVHVCTGASMNTIGGTLAGMVYSNEIKNNASHGVQIDSGASENMIGGTATGGGNLIARNEGDGIEIQGSGTTANVVQGNTITGLDQFGDFIHFENGVTIDSGASENTIGNENAGNIITLFDGDGVQVDGDTSVRNSIQANNIFNNQELGIDLGGDGVTPNAPGGPHVGPNNLQNYPVITNVTPGSVQFTLDSGANNIYTVDFYANAAPDKSNHGQGRTWLGSMTSASVNFPYTFTYSPVPGEPFISATATDFVGNTSEFSLTVGPEGVQALNGHLFVNVDPGQSFRLARDPVFPQFLDLGMDKTTVSIDPSAFAQIAVFGSAGSEIDIEDVPAGLPLSVTTSGQEMVNISPGARNLANIQSPVTIKGDGGGLTLNIYDASDPLADVYALGNSSFSDQLSAGILFGGVNNVNLIGSSLADTYNVLNTPGSASTAIYSNGGGDTINVEATAGPLTVYLPAVGNPEVNVSPTAQHLDTIAGNLNLVGQGFGTLVLDDQASTVARNYVLSSDGLAGGNSAQVGFSDLAKVSLHGTAFSDTVTVQSLPAAGVMLDGGGGSNTLIGPDVSNTWLLAQPNGVEGTLHNSLLFNSFSALIGGQGADRFVVPDGAFIPEFISGGDGANGGGSNTLDLSAWTKALTEHVMSSPFGGTVPGVVRAFALCQNVIGGQGDDRFLFDQGFGLTTVDGGPGNNTLDFSPYFASPLPAFGFSILGHDSGLVAGVIESFSNIQNLIGTQANDRFAFRGAAYLDGTIDGGGGSNAVFYTQATSNVTVNLRSGAASGVNLQGGSIPQPRGIRNVLSFVGSQSAPSTLIAPDTINTWTINGANSGNLGAYGFSSFGQLVGGAAADTFVFGQGGSITGTVDGGGGTNTLDYSKYTGNVTVELPLNRASLIEQGAAGGIANIVDVTGSIGNDLVVGDGNANVLIGGSGRNVLVGGAGSDTLDSSRSAGDNILIGGRTDFDTWPSALDAIFAEWTRTDLSFRDRYSDLNTGTNGTGASALNVVSGQLILLTPATNPGGTNGTVHADTSPDTLTGSNQIDPATGRRVHNWFFYDADDIVIGFLSSSDHNTKVR